MYSDSIPSTVWWPGVAAVADATTLETCDRNRAASSSP